jgi:hypothetical protein
MCLMARGPGHSVLLLHGITLVFHGLKDPALPALFSRRACDLTPNSELILLDSISRSKPTAFQAVSFQQVFSFERPESGRSCR